MASPRALPAPIHSVFMLDEAALNHGIQVSRRSDRGRIMQPLQRDVTCPVQRLLNFMQPASYVQPHCHPAMHAIETVVPLKGAIMVWTFDRHGVIQHRQPLRAGNPAASLFDIEPGVWHTFAAIEADTVVLEIKKGPYDPVTDKQFATWAPKEGTAEAMPYLERLLDPNA